LYDDPLDHERVSSRSGHNNCATRHIPVIFYCSGAHAEYRQPGDEVPKLDFQMREKVARTVFATLWETGEVKTRPAEMSPPSNRSGSGT
jgi:hypothetical protein